MMMINRLYVYNDEDFLIDMLITPDQILASYDNVKDVLRIDKDISNPHIYSLLSSGKSTLYYTEFKENSKIAYISLDGVKRLESFTNDLPPEDYKHFLDWLIGQIALIRNCEKSIEAKTGDTDYPFTSHLLSDYSRCKDVTLKVVSNESRQDFDPFIFNQDLVLVAINRITERIGLCFLADAIDYTEVNQLTTTLEALNKLLELFTE